MDEKFKKIIKKFDKEEKFKYKEVKYVEKNYELLKDKLLEVVENFTNNLGNYEDEYPLSVLYCLFILALHREKKLFNYLIKTLRYVDKDGLDFFAYFGEGLYEYMHAFMIYTFDSQYDEVDEVILNHKYDSCSRGIALNMYSYYYQNNIKTRSEVIDFLGKLIASEFDYVSKEDVENDSYYEIFDSISYVIETNSLYELVDSVKKMYDLGLVNEMIYGTFEKYKQYVYSDSTPCIYNELTSIENDFASWYIFHKNDDKNKTVINKNKKKKKDKKPKTNYKNKKKKRKK